MSEKKPGERKMKKYAIVLFAVPILITMSYARMQPTEADESPVLQGPYLGQERPGTVPVFFAPGIVSHADFFEHSAAVFSPDGREVYWSAIANGQRYPRIYYMKQENGAWSKRRIAPFCKEIKGYDDPVISPNGEKFFFDYDGDIWCAGRQGDSWSEAERVSPLINSSAFEQMSAVTRNGSIYFIRYPGFNVYVSRKVNGNYVAPEKLAETVNSAATRQMAVYVPPDESYMIIEASNDSSTCELFVSYKTSTNSWSPRVRLPIDWGRFPSVSPDGKYLFFMTREGIYWVGSSIVKDLKPKALQ